MTEKPMPAMASPTETARSAASHHRTGANIKRPHEAASQAISTALLAYIAQPPWRERVAEAGRGVGAPARAVAGRAGGRAAAESIADAPVATANPTKFAVHANPCITA